MSINVCFNGCSFTYGEGFPDHQKDQFIYDWLVSRHFGFCRTNVALPGSSNHLIFMRSADALLSKKFDIVVTQWTALNRIWFYPGPDTEYFVNDQKFPDYTYRDFYLSPREKKKFNEILLIMNHDFHKIIELVDYCKILNSLAESTGAKIVYVNGLLPWKNDLISPILDDFDKNLSAYTKEILDFENRNDSEILEFFNILHKKMQEIDQSNWINIFDSWAKNISDTGPEGHHPGIESHRWMANKIIRYLENIL